MTDSEIVSLMTDKLEQAESDKITLISILQNLLSNQTNKSTAETTARKVLKQFTDQQK